MTNDLDDYTKLILFIIMVLGNLIFILAWLIFFLESLAIKMWEKSPRMAKLCCPCFVNRKEFLNLVHHVSGGVALWNLKGRVHDTTKFDINDTHIIENPQNSMYDELDQSNESICKPDYSATSRSIVPGDVINQSPSFDRISPIFVPNA